MPVSRPVLALLWLIAALVFTLLYGPLLIPIASSFFESSRAGIDWQTPSLSSYVQLTSNGGILTAVRNTFLVGLVATVLATIIGCLLAVYYCSTESRWREVVQLIIFLPFLMPPIVIGLSLLIAFRETGIPRSLLTVVIGHTVFILALAYRIIVMRLAALPRSLVEASYDLGASLWQTFFYVVLPDLKSALIGAAVVCFALSFDETLITILVTGTDNTLPIRLWAMMRLGFSPDINALVSIVLGLTTLLCTAAVYFLMKERSAAPA